MLQKAEHKNEVAALISSSLLVRGWEEKCLCWSCRNAADISQGSAMVVFYNSISLMDIRDDNVCHLHFQSGPFS